ncbi:HDOD domain-containing protein [Desulfobacterales bacterium HSG17]|nr:HDOD domain-containing protein [Desulfobacterales bacterium HSG17]
MKDEKKKFLKKLQNIKDIPSLPLIVMKVNKMLDDYNTTNDSLSKVIEKDQAIVFKMLLLVNSAFFGLREKVSSVKEASVILGFDAIRNIIISLSVFKTLNRLSQKKSNELFNVDDFWKHSIAVAVLSKQLSEKLGIADPEKCFVNGLLHDTGKLILAYYMKDDFKALMLKAREANLMFMAVEKKILPVNHCEIGYIIAKKWGLPDVISNTIYHHHRIRTGCPAWDESIIVNSADGYANSFIQDSLNRTTSSGRIIHEYFDPNSKKQMKLVLESSQEWFVDAQKLINDANSFFFNM